jgi:uncharacterized GH25 family protein
MFHCRSVLLALVFFLAASKVGAHDLWLIPPLKATLKESVVMEAGIGMEFPLSVVAPAVDRYPRKFVVQPDGKTLPLKSAGKKDLVSFLEFEPALQGIYVIAVETTPKIIELEADRFNEYLVTDGMPHIFRLRAKEKTLNQPAKERYRKSPTVLVSIGAGMAGAWNKPIGLPLEIVALQNPFERKPGDTLRVQVLFHKNLWPAPTSAGSAPATATPPSATSAPMPKAKPSSRSPKPA